MYSIKSLEGISKNRVIGYAPRIVIDNARFVVSEAGRQRVIRTGRKNVHAGCVGDLVMVSGYIMRMHNSKAEFLYCNEEKFNEQFSIDVPITYSPYKCKTFVNHANVPVHNANRVVFNGHFVGVQV